MKLLVFDVEGTIFQTKYKLPGVELSSTVWQMLAKILGNDAMEDEIGSHNKWNNGIYKNYIEWMEDTINIHLKYGLTQAAFDEVINNAQYNHGVKEFFDSLDRGRFVPVLISGGFQNLSQRAQIDLKIRHSYTACIVI